MAHIFVKRPPHNGRKAEHGQAILELLPVVVLLLTLTFGVIDFGRALWQLQVMTGLTREGSSLASRNTTLADALTAVVNDGSVLNLNSSSGKVIITSVKNTGSSLVMTEQVVAGSLKVTSKVGSYVVNGTDATNKATLPTSGTPAVPQVGDTIYVTEIYSKASPITPLGALAKSIAPTQLYDAAFF